MNDQAHLVLATSISAFITWTLNCIFSTRRESTSSIFQQIFVDQFDDGFLVVRCVVVDQQDAKECGRILLKGDRMKIGLFLIYLPVIVLLLLFYGRPLFFRIRSVLVTIFVVWLLNRCCTDSHLQNPLDLVTVYLLVWQFVQLICHWESHELWWPALILQQASLCFFLAFTAFVQYDLLFRHFPSQARFVFLWFRSIRDIFACLHPRGYLREDLPSNPASVGCPTYPSGEYYPRDYETRGELQVLGLGDFLMYNLMVLFPLYPMASMSTKLWIFCGSIVSIQIGNVGTTVLGRLWKQNSMPGLPLPVVMFSAYVLFLSAIIHP